MSHVISADAIPSTLEAMRAMQHFPTRLTPQEFYPGAYRSMYLSRKLEERIIDLFKKGQIKGTVALATGNEAVNAGMAIPLRPGKDFATLMHRNIGAHLILSRSPFELLCQYCANAQSPTHGREGNVHHGNAAMRIFPMVSHLGNMLSVCVGAVWSARQQGETDVIGVAPVGDGATSTGDFHESINLAAVRKVPVLFLIENNYYAYSTPTRLQYACKKLSDRAIGYGINGQTIDGTDAYGVYTTVCNIIEQMQQTSLPYILEVMTLRLKGHAVYDTADYVSAAENSAWQKQDPLPKARTAMLDCGALSLAEVAALEESVIVEINDAVDRALRVGRPDPAIHLGAVFAPRTISNAEPFSAEKIKNGNAVTLALDYLLKRHPQAFIAGMDIGVYGSAFKTCKGLHANYGSDRVMDLPICESAITGFALGASQAGGRPVVEYQFADFSTEAATQLGFNTSTWFFRNDKPAPIVYRLPCGGGITLGAFHSSEMEGLWSRFCGLKMLYPFTPQETFEALIAAFYDPNPVMVLEHKLLYWSKGGDISFNGDIESIWRPRQYCEGNDITVVSLGAMLDIVLNVQKSQGLSMDIWNPFMVNPLDLDPVFESVKKTGRLLVVQENTEPGGLGDRIVSLVTRHCFNFLVAAPVLISAPSIPVPFAPELEAVYRPAAAQVLSAINTVMNKQAMRSVHV